MEKLKITKPIKLIELFGGIGSQAKALQNIGANFTRHKVVEFDKYCINSYNEIHGTNFETSDITKIHAEDLEIIDRESYTYLITYSFPCTDISLVGRLKGMSEETRSGLLWQVERILNELGDNLPQVLLMENVPTIHSKRYIEFFDKWQDKLCSLGYKNYWQDLNSVNYGIPQNRNRCFMVSVLGDYCYEFPKPIKLKLSLKDILEKKVDNKYYISNRMKDYIVNNNQKYTGNNNKSIINRKIASTINTAEGTRRCDASNYICENLPEECDIKKIKTKLHDFNIRKLTPNECFRLMGFTDEDFEKASKVNSNTQLYKQAGNSIVVNVLENIFKEMIL